MVWIYVCGYRFSNSFLYCYFYNELSLRPGDYTTLDIVVAVIAIIILLEAGRRVLGLALSIIAIIFSLFLFRSLYARINHS